MQSYVAPNIRLHDLSIAPTIVQAEYGFGCIAIRFGVWVRMKKNRRVQQIVLASAACNQSWVVSVEGDFSWGSRFEKAG